MYRSGELEHRRRSAMVELAAASVRHDVVRCKRWRVDSDGSSAVSTERRWGAWQIPARCRIRSRWTRALEELRTSW